MAAVHAAFGIRDGHVKMRAVGSKRAGQRQDLEGR